MITIIAMGIRCKSYAGASRVLGCTKDAVSHAVRTNRRSIKGKPFWFPWEKAPEKPKPATPKIKRRPGRKGRHCIIDDIEYDSIQDAYLQLGFNKQSLRSALDTRDYYKGHSIMWANQED